MLNPVQQITVRPAGAVDNDVASPPRGDIADRLELAQRLPFRRCGQLRHEESGFVRFENLGDVGKVAIAQNAAPEERVVAAHTENDQQGGVSIGEPRNINQITGCPPFLCLVLVADVLGHSPQPLVPRPIRVLEEIDLCAGAILR